ncbi:Y4yA family PLP-dependent enzyme [Nocardia sp. ET3-3]|uniref:Y4yA family PLP-dependent enzyme n=1 Tax=Nocardia terrae TaxID=2675851 RepID=A0A7K1V5C7_9NOCA|nr:alanine racemase [Nocardia terrae]MVU81659.1 Y4yA family PLP-dependent enzyme [Nocardia terrae]
MPAELIEWEKRLLADDGPLRTIAQSVGGPFHVMFPDRIVENISKFKDAFEASGVTGFIYYGKKANKSACVIEACATAGAGVDVASARELSAALRGGIDGSNLMVTGPAKSDELLMLATEKNALIAIDSPSELDRLSELSHRRGADTRARIVLRVLPKDSTSRFGMTDAELDNIWDQLDDAPVRLEGFSFHLSGYEVAPRAELAQTLIDWCLKARVNGHAANLISIGGGFSVKYIAAEYWNSFLEHATPSWFHGGRAPSLDSYYPYYCKAPGPQMLTAILEHNDLGDRLRKNDIRLAIEPGRALLDRAGSTVFRVQGTKTREAHGLPYEILTVDGTSLSLSEQWFDTEYLPDPVLWPESVGTMTPTCIGGASCLESDMLSWRRIPLQRAAVVNDLLVYPNTAGYQMDSNESEFHELPIPPKIILRDSTAGPQFEWTPEIDPRKT